MEKESLTFQLPETLKSNINNTAEKLEISSSALIRCTMSMLTGTPIEDGDAKAMLALNTYLDENKE